MVGVVLNKSFGLPRRCCENVCFARVFMFAPKCICTYVLGEIFTCLAIASYVMCF